MLKSLSPAAIPGALKLAAATRQGGQPQTCESICHDVLQAEPGNQDALRLLVLSHADRFDNPGSEQETAARDAQERLTSGYDRAFFDGLIHHRSAQAAIASGSPMAARVVYELLTRAMTSYEEAESLRPEANSEAILMWNACQRLLQSTPHTGPRETQAFETYIGE
jgi:hypothetical protein